MKFRFIFVDYAFHIGQVNSKSCKPIQLQLNRKRTLGSVRQVHDQGPVNIRRNGSVFGRSEMGKLSKKDS